MEDIFEAACERLDIRGAVLLATSADGRFEYGRAFGQATLDKPLTLDSTFWIASCSKLITSIAALQCVERGQIGLDDDVTSILHELKHMQILKGFDLKSGEPILSEARGTITLRRLLSHSSGMGYDFTSPLLARWRTYQHEKIGIPASEFTKNYRLPLVFEPGEGWEYGSGLDWLGILVERVSGTDLQDYMQKHIWSVLGIQDMTFHLEKRPDIRARLPLTSKRSAEGKIDWVTELIIPDPSEEALGGAGIYSTAPEYLKVLHSILANSERLLTVQSVDEMFRPQLSPESKRCLNSLQKSAEGGTGFGLPRETSVDHSLAGIINMEDLATGRKSGSISWGGYPNLKWWIDRVTGLCGLYASQLHPPADPKSLELYQIFQEEMYRRSRPKE